MTPTPELPSASEPPPYAPSSGSRLGRLVRKELSETLRDRRTLLTLVLMPLLLYPLLALVVRPVTSARLLEEAAVSYRIAFTTEHDANQIVRFLGQGADLLVQQGMFRKQGQDSAPAGAALLPRLDPVVIEDVEGAVFAGLVDVGVRPRPGPDQGGCYDVLYADDSQVGLEAIRHMGRLCDRADGQLLYNRLVRVGVRPPELLQLAPTPVLRPQPRQESPFLALVPLVLVLMTITGAVYPAIDLTAGERERGTLEVLMAAPVPRLSLLLAKYTAVVMVAVLTGLVNLAAMALSLHLSGLGPRLLGEQGLSMVALVQVFFLLLLFAAFFSAVVLALTSMARSFKEAQAYLVPLMVVALAPGVLSLVPGVRLEGLVLVVPLLNIVLLGRDVFAGMAQPMDAAVVVGATLLYALAAVALAAALFGREAVLSGSPAGRRRWWRWLRRK